MSSFAIAIIAAMTAAAPAMSDFIVSIMFDGLIERPPESNVIPLPTIANLALGLRTEWVSLRRHGGRCEPSPTPRIPPIFSFRRRSTFHSSTLSDVPDAASVARCARSSGALSRGGVFTKSLASETASMIAEEDVAVAFHPFGASMTSSVNGLRSSGSDR